jgi:quinol monooxygenase YgiN
MVVVINDDRVSDVEAYLPVAKAFAADSAANEEGCISMEVLVDQKVEGRVLYLSHFESEEAFLKSTQGAIFHKWLPELGKYFISAEDHVFEVK